RVPSLRLLEDVSFHPDRRAAISGLAAYPTGHTPGTIGSCRRFDQRSTHKDGPPFLPRSGARSESAPDRFSSGTSRETLWWSANIATHPGTFIALFFRSARGLTRS